MAPGDITLTTAAPLSRCPFTLSLLDRPLSTVASSSAEISHGHESAAGTWRLLLAGERDTPSFDAEARPRRSTSPPTNVT